MLNFDNALKVIDFINEYKIKSLNPTYLEFKSTKNDLFFSWMHVMTVVLWL